MAVKTLRFDQLKKAGYNRGINRAHVNRIKRNFHEDMVQPAIVSFRDGNYYIIDHQHQSQAIYELNNSDPSTPIKCIVRTGMTYEEEADLYYRLNTGSKALSFADKLIGQIEAKDAAALDFRDTVEACGYVIGGYSNKSLKALSNAWGIFKKEGGKERLVKILTLTHSCWPDNPDGVSKPILNGIDLFLQHHENDYRIDHFASSLALIDPREVQRKANTFYGQMDSRSFTRPYCTYVQLVTIYNRGLRNKLIPATPNA